MSYSETIMILDNLQLFQFFDHKNAQEFADGPIFELSPQTNATHR